MGIGMVEVPLAMGIGTVGGAARRVGRLRSRGELQARVCRSGTGTAMCRALGA